MTSSDSSPDTEVLLDRAAQGDHTAVETVLDRQRPRLRKLVAVRLDRRLASRVDASDVIQDAMVDATRALGAFLKERPLPFYPWLRQIVLTRLLQIHRFHLHTQRRTVHREALINGWCDSSHHLVEHFVAQDSGPSRQVERDESRLRVQAAIEQLSPDDREVLVLRYLEHLSTQEAAAVLEITPNTFAQRHLRSVKRLRRLLDERRP